MPPSESGPARNAVGWALLSQAIWLPLLAIAVHDRWLSAPPGSVAADPLSAVQAAAPSLQSPAQAPPLSLRELEMATRSPQDRPDRAAEAADPAASASAGLVLRSPGGIAALRPGLPAGLSGALSVGGSAAMAVPQAPAAAPGGGPSPGPFAIAPGRAGGRAGSAAELRPKPGSRASQPPGQPAVARPRSGSEPSASAVSAALLHGAAALRDGAAARRSVSLSQLLGGSIGLRDLAGVPIASGASHSTGSGGASPAAEHRGGQGAAPGGNAAGGRPARLVWAPPPPLPPLP